MKKRETNFTQKIQYIRQIYYVELDYNKKCIILDIFQSNEKSGTDNNTDSSQDSHDVADAKTENTTVENDVESKTEPDKPKEETDGDDKSAEKKVEVDEKNEIDKKSQSDSEEVENKDNKKEKKEKEEKEEEKSENSEKDEEEDEIDGKKEVPLLDQPLELSGKRERKNVQRLEITSEIKEVSYRNLLKFILFHLLNF